MSKLKLFLTLTGYQLTWLACVFGEKQFSEPKLGIYIGSIFLILYFYFSTNKLKFIKILLLISIPGYFFDSIIVYFSIYYFNTNFIFGNLPLWMIILWLSFSVLFDEILLFLKDYLILAVILSCILGPLTYYLGQPIGIISINSILLFSVYLILFWGFLMIYYIKVVLRITQKSEY